MAVCIAFAFVAGAATQSREPANVSVGHFTPTAAAIAEGVVSAAANVTSALTAALFVAAKNAAPPPIE